MRGSFTFPNLLPLYLALFAVTFIPRFLPMAILTRFNLPGWFQRWLANIPAAILAALTAQTILVHGKATVFRPDQIAAAVVAGVIAWRTKSLFLTVIGGIVAVVVMRAVI